MKSQTTKDLVLKLEEAYHLIKAGKTAEAEEKLAALDVQDTDPNISAVWTQLNIALNPTTIIADPRYLEDIGSQLNTLLYTYVNQPLTD